MKRLAVSLLFILIAWSFAAEANGALKKLTSWTSRARARYAVHACNRLASRHPATMSPVKGDDDPGVRMMHFNNDLRLRTNLR